MKLKLNIILLIVLFSCKSLEKTTNERCPRYVTKSIKKTKIDKFKFTLNKDTLHFKEVKFYCVQNTASYTSKVMFDKFGKWNKEIYPINERHPILLWANLKLFKKDTTRFTIATLGEENKKTVYASFMVFDNEGNDLLVNSLYEKKLISYFKDLIQKSNPKRREFYDIYWKTIQNRAKE